MRLRALAATGLVALCALAPAATSAPSASLQVTEAAARFPFRSYVVALPGGLAPDGLSANVTENGNPVPDVTLIPASAAKRGSFGVVLAVDASDSMAGNPIAAAVKAARAFAAKRTRTQQLGIVSFNSTSSTRLGLTASSTRIGEALRRAPRLAYGTHIYDGVERALQLLAAAKVASGTIVLLSDGADTGSTTSAAAVSAAAQKAHVRIFTVGFRSGAFDQAALTALAARTGGAFAAASSPAALSAVYSSLSSKLSSEYLLQYRSLAGPNEKVTVAVSVAGLSAPLQVYRTPSLPAVTTPPYHASSTDTFLRSTGAMLVVALLCALLIAAALWAVLRAPASSLQRRVSDFVALSVPERSPRATATTVNRVPAEQAADSRMARLGEALAIADISIAPRQLVVLTILSTVVAVFGAGTIFGSPVFGIFGFLVPLFVYNAVKARLERKRRRFADQLPDTLQIVASALRAGHTIIGALAVVSTEAPEPTSSEMRRVVADEQLGVPIDMALERVAVRMASEEFEQVAVVAGLQREAGGNAAEVLDRVADNVRERIELRQLVRSLTAQGRLSRWVLTLLPPGLAGIIALLDPGYLSPLVDKSLGRAILVMALVMVVIGSVLIKRIVEIKV